MIITISGKAASGKSTLAKYLKERLPDAVYFELDKINEDLFHEQNVKDYALRLFGKSVINSDGTFNKKLISDAIYSDTRLYNWWHDYMLIRVDEYLDEYIKNSSHTYYILEHVLIYESKFYTLSDIKIHVKIDEDTRVERVLARDNITYEELMSREECVDDDATTDFDISYNGHDEEKIAEYIVKNS